MVMLLVAALASFVVLATGVAADPSNHRRYPPFPMLSIVKRIDPHGKYNFVQSDRRRFTRLANNASHVSSLSLAEESADLSLNDTGSSYQAKIAVGMPPTFYNLIVDSGSSNTWVGANAPYVTTNTSVNTSESVEVKYGSGSFTGNLYNDTVTVSPGVTASGQPIGVSFNSTGIYPSDGILGIGPTDLTYGTASYPDNSAVASTIPTVTDTLFAQGTIKQNLVAVSFEPTTSGSVVNGELTFGDTDSSKYIGDINYSPITTSSVAGKFWGIDATIQYGGSNGSSSTNIADTSSGFVDTGTTLIYLSTSAYDQYVQATGAVLDSSTGLLRLTDAQYESLQSLYFVIGGNTFELTPNAQIWQRALNNAVQGDGDAIYLVIQNVGQSFPGVDFICGMTFLERFYSIFDTGNRRVGLAMTQFTNATTN
ncbi:acid protease [Russula emetica]|nr:acid protease [Russula emetica]